METKSFDQCGTMPHKKQTSSTVNLNIKSKKNSRSRKREKHWMRGMKKMESPYSSHPKSDHIRSKSSYIKGPKSFKSIFQIYREAGINGNNLKDLKSSKINTSLPVQFGKEGVKIGSLNFKVKKGNSKSRRTQKHDKSLPSHSVSMNTRNRSSNKRGDLIDKRSKKIDTIGTLVPNDYVQIEDKPKYGQILDNPSFAPMSDFIAKATKSPTVQKSKTSFNKIHKNKKNFMKPKKNSTKDSFHKQRETPKSKNQSKKNDLLRGEDILDKSYNPGDRKAHNIYSSMFSEGPGIQNQINSMIFPQRPGSNASMTANSEYNVNNSIETSQNSLRQAIMSVLKNKNSKNQMETLYTANESNVPFDTRFTKSLQINSPGSKISHRESKPAVKSPARRLFFKYKTTLHEHNNTVNCLALDTKFYSHLFSGSKDYKIKVWH